MNPTCTLVLSVLMCVGYSTSRKIPSYVSLCHREDPKLEQCFINAVEQIRPYFREGVPDLFIPPMDPLVIPQAGLNSGDNFKASFKNIQIYYADEFKIDHLKVDLNKVHIDLIVSFPRLRIKSTYNIDGRILILTLKGQGPADGNFTNVGAKLTVDGERYFKKGKEFIAITDKKLDLSLGKPVFYFDNFFRDNPELNEQTNKIINENIVDILDELRPVVDQTVTEFVLGIVTRLFNRYSMDELFPN
ncbi:putative beta-carotene-binding protein [Tribolium madens]|uniref:putative beta-carotene-binding protein n=1 Tax=Tribolium madens TaxID=41895 RepID=UPI001CF763E4|nr:putative beta-carotene-binding protein [Tribolium madens]